MATEPLDGYPVRIDVPVAWGEMDAFGHVNNTVYFRYFESARIAYFTAIEYLDLMRATGLGPILAETRCRFRLPLAYPDTVTVGARAGELAASGFEMEYLVYSQRHGRIAAEGSSRIVSYDYEKQCKAPLPEELRTRIERLQSGG